MFKVAIETTDYYITPKSEIGMFVPLLLTVNTFNR